ncbi:hypothetical protein ACU4GH_31885 [Bradyrhizobium betae]
MHDAELRGGLGEAALAGDGHEGQQIVEILVRHGPIIHGPCRLMQANYTG